MSSPELQLQTLFTFDAEGRITGTREPFGTRGPLFALIRSSAAVAFAARSDLPSPLVEELLAFAKREPPAQDLRQPPVFAASYLSLLAERLALHQDLRAKASQSDGPAFVFPEGLTPPTDVQVIQDERGLDGRFGSWQPGEIGAGREPVFGVVRDGEPVSICFCARSSERAAEAGLVTQERHRGAGFGPRVTTAWAFSIRASGRTPLYSTSWTNHASLTVARKLGLLAYASDWSLLDASS
jgi:hypothetical protein